MRKVRTITGLLVLIMLLALFSGCDSLKGKESSEEAEKLTLTFYYPRDGSQTVKRLILAYNDQQDDVVIDWIEAPGVRTEYAEKLKAILNAGEEFPDVLMIHDTWLAQLAEAKQIQPLDGGLSREKKDEFFPGMMDAMVYKGKVYGLPFWQDTPLLYYRSDLVSSPPSSWAQLEQVAEAAAAANEIPSGLLFPGKPQENAAAFLAGIWSAYNAYPDFRQKEVTFDEAAMMAALERLNSMVLNNIIPPDVVNMSPEDCRASFEKGNAVFMWNWSYAARLLQDEKSPLHGKVGVSPIPGLEDGTGSTGILSGYAFSMSKNTTSIPEVWSFMKYMTDEQSQQQLADAGLMPAKVSLYNNTAWLNKAALPVWFGDVLRTGQALKLGPGADGQLNMISQSSVLSIEQRKDPVDIMLYLREGVIAEDPEEDSLGEAIEDTTEEGADE